MVSFGIILISALVLIFVWDQNKEKVSDIGSNVVVLFFVFLIEFAITNEFNFFVLYINELYPTQVRIIALGFIKIFGGVILMLEA